jgi:hypothetical protein
VVGVAPDSLQALGGLAERQRGDPQGDRRRHLERPQPVPVERLARERRRLRGRDAGQRRRERGHRRQRAGARPCAARAAPDRLQPIELARPEGTERRPDEADRQQALSQVLVVGRQLLRRALGELHALGR